MKISIKKNTIEFLLISVLIALIVGNRGDTRDTIAYYRVFKYINDLDVSNPAIFYIFTGMEIGFGWYSYVIRMVTNSHIILFTIFSFLIFYTIYLVSKKIKVRILLVFMLFI